MNQGLVLLAAWAQWLAVVAVLAWLITRRVGPGPKWGPTAKRPRQER